MSVNIILTTFNARYMHASLGLRYLLANMGALQAQTRLQEFTLALSGEDAVERLLQFNPRVIGGVHLERYRTLETVTIIKAVAPE